MLLRARHSLILGAAACLVLACADAGDGGLGQVNTATIEVCSGVPAEPPVFYAIGPARAEGYDGPVVVEQSSEGLLSLRLASSSAAVDGGAEVVQIISFRNFPIAPGAQLWLIRLPDPLVEGDAQRSTAFEVRDRQGGALLFGNVAEAPGQNLGPFRAKVLAPVCKTTKACITWVHRAVEIRGETAVTARDNGGVTVRLEGRDYQVSVTAAQTKRETPDCFIQSPDLTQVNLYYEAKDLAALVPAAP